MSKTKPTSVEEDVFYDFYCRSCDEEWTSNQVEHECQNCGSKSIVIEVKRPKVIRYTRRTLMEPDYDWENEVKNAR